MGLSFPSKPLREAPGITSALVQPWNELMASLRDYFGKVPRVYFAELMVRTGQTNQSAFPIEVSTPEGLVPKGVTVCYVQNLDVPETQLHTQAVFCDWRPSSAGITVRYLTGLFSGAYAPANWRIVLRVEGD